MQPGEKKGPSALKATARLVIQCMCTARSLEDFNTGMEWILTRGNVYDFPLCMARRGFISFRFLYASRMCDASSDLCYREKSACVNVGSANILQMARVKKKWRERSANEITQFCLVYLEMITCEFLCNVRG